MAKTRNITMELLSICAQMGWYGGRTMPVLLEAVPGCAKTQGIQLLGKKLGEYLHRKGVAADCAVETFVLPQTMPESIEGIPSPDMDQHALTRLPLIGIRNLINSRYGIAFLDEITSCSPQTGSSAMTFVQDGVAGDVRVPETVARIAACNPPDCAAAGRELSPPEINRFLKLEWKLPLEDFLDFLRGGEGIGTHIRFLPEDWEQRNFPRAAALVAHYLYTHPKSCNTMESGTTNVVNASKPWASQRQWYNVTRLLAAVFSIGEEASSDMAYLAVQGTVGEGVADEFIGYLRDMDLPDPEEIIKEAMKQVKGESLDKRKKRLTDTIPKAVWDRADKLRVFLESVATCAQADHEERAERWVAAWDIMEPILETKPDNATSAAQILSTMPAKDKNGKPLQVPESCMMIFKAREAAGMASTKKRSK